MTSVVLRFSILVLWDMIKYPMVQNEISGGQKALCQENDRFSEHTSEGIVALLHVATNAGPPL